MRANTLRYSHLRGLKLQLGERTVLSADAGYHSEDGLKALAAEDIDAYIPDNAYRKRDERHQGKRRTGPNPTHFGTSAPKKPSWLRSSRRISNSIPSRKPASARPANASTATARSTAFGP
jgi:hypothetical protein